MLGASALLLLRELAAIGHLGVVGVGRGTYEPPRAISGAVGVEQGANEPPRALLCVVPH